MRKYSLLYLGLLLTCAYLLQDFFDWRWQWLFKLQADESYRLITGLLLGLYIAAQWLLFLARLQQKMRDAKQFYKVHKILGAFSPLLFYLHSMEMGYGFLLCLSALFLANTVLGLLNRELINFRGLFAAHLWLFWHICLSMIIVVLLYLHFSIAVLYH